MNMMILRIAVAISLSVSIPQSTQAWCLGPKGCVTDDTVCDMGRNTTDLLAARTFVWSKAPRHNEIYVRLAMQQILNNCKNGQQLILHSDGSLPMDQSVLPDVAKSFCRVADISRSPVHSVDVHDGEAIVGFESKCVISKMEQARTAHANLEKEISTQTLIEEGNRTPAHPVTSSKSPTDSGAPANAPDCTKIGAGVLFGLPGPCAGQGRVP